LERVFVHAGGNCFKLLVGMLDEVPATQPILANEHNRIFGAPWLGTTFNHFVFSPL
jgi:hypothetical protein